MITTVPIVLRFLMNPIMAFMPGRETTEPVMSSANTFSTSKFLYFAYSRQRASCEFRPSPRLICFALETRQ